MPHIYKQATNQKRLVAPPLKLFPNWAIFLLKNDAFLSLIVTLPSRCYISDQKAWKSLFTKEIMLIYIIDCRSGLLTVSSYLQKIVKNCVKSARLYNVSLSMSANEATNMFFIMGMNLKSLACQNFALGYKLG